MINWTITEKEESLVAAIAMRARTLLNHPQMHTRMNLVACHNSGQPLDFVKLLDFPDSDFIHDLAGIEANLDKETGELQNCFVPRCALPADD